MQKLELTAYQIFLIQAFYGRLTPEQKKAFLDTMYKKLFELKEALRMLFKHLDAQKEKLSATIDALILNLNDLTPLVPEITRLGKFHAKFVTAEDYALVGQAILFALEEISQVGFSPEMKGAWATMYGIASGLMQEAGKEA